MFRFFSFLHYIQACRGLSLRGALPYRGAKCELSAHLHRA
ncbi:hypothetical protein HMPREF1556_01658 [Porphyromonas sp. oral taxon 278 str. W7784]|nr:hypothetical protein HMPREF1556_01658 [Porphyromonas sp. oral taxon 278 str. W7784]